MKFLLTFTVLAASTTAFAGPKAAILAAPKPAAAVPVNVTPPPVAAAAPEVSAPADEQAAPVGIVVGAPAALGVVNGGIPVGGVTTVKPPTFKKKNPASQ